MTIHTYIRTSTTATDLPLFAQGTGCTEFLALSLCGGCRLFFYSTWEEVR